ncbi:MAG: preprotein translocase subunit YajC [Candidatus Bipolaricaulota bacterium]|nr:preprotein translocase subunit YajC [Candidatus Bipolaricaulota bacterium]
MSRMVLFIAGLLVLLLGVAVFGQEATPAAGSSVISLVVILAVFGAVFYFMLIRPQRKRQAKHNELVTGLKRGDKIVTAGGIYGEIDSIGDTSVVLTLEDGGKVRLAKSSIVSKRAK